MWVNLPQCGLTCPNVAAGLGSARGGGAGGGWWAISTGPRPGYCHGHSAYRPRFHSDTSAFTGIQHFASVITLAKCCIPLRTPLRLQNSPVGARRARHPFENSTSLANERCSPPDRPIFNTSLREEGTSCQTQPRPADQSVHSPDRPASQHRTPPGDRVPRARQHGGSGRDVEATPQGSPRATARVRRGRA